MISFVYISQNLDYLSINIKVSITREFSSTKDVAFEVDFSEEMIWQSVILVYSSGLADSIWCKMVN